MGWRYRKRIRILPGIHINISKSGISTNVGVKGASVTFGPKGTYVNAGLPGTGLYRRDKVNGNGITKYPTENYHNHDEIPQSMLVAEEYDKTTSILAYNPLHYIFFFLSLFFPIAAFVWYLNGLNMIYSSLINAVFQAIWGLAIILNMSVKEDTSSYKIKPIKDVSEHFIKREIQGHWIRCSLCVIIITLNLFPLLSMSGAFVKMFIGYEKTWDGGFISILMTLIVVYLWISALKKEKKFIIPLNDALLLKDEKGSSLLTVPQTNEECKTTNDEIIKESNVNITHETAVIETLREKSKAESCSQKMNIGNDVGKDCSDSDNSLSTDTQNKKDSVIYQEDNLEPYDPKRDLENYHYPTLDLLIKYENDGLPYFDMEEQNANKNRIIDTLRNFDVEISSIKATVGPRFTLYEINLALGVSIYKIRGLEDDIALQLGTQSVRIIAPIPGKGTVGIEVPNMKVSIASIESILNSKKFQESTMELPCALGKTITNEVFMFDLTRAPHVLIAGSTGQGKSVAINALITSLLYKKHPAELKFVLMDPCVIELGVYEMIERHFLAALCNDPSVVINSHQAVETLNSLCREMDVRYDLLKMAFARNIKEYNRKFIDRQLNPEIGHKFMPYIVVIIDEYANFISETGKEFELPLARLAQLARAVGIHMIISTKRPTNDIITGTIKSNFSTRISFRVPESVDSRVILDREGAERLLGNGDMLYVNGGEPVRVQCAYIDTLETERICQFISQQQGYISPFELPDPYFDENEYGGESRDADMQHLDPMFEDAARLIVREQSGNTSLIQRKFAIGYNRAGRLMDQLEKAGIVGAAHGSKPREVLIMDETSLENLLSQWRR